jgi:hypothetical protein
MNGAFDLGNEPTAAPPTVEEQAQMRAALGIPETSSAYSDQSLAMEPLFEGSFVREGEFTPPSNWEDILIVLRVDIPYVSVGSIVAALQIKTVTGGHVIPWAIPVEATDPYSSLSFMSPRLNVIRLQRAGDAVMLNVYMSNDGYPTGDFLNAMNSFSQPTSFADYNLGDGSGGGYGGDGYGGYGGDGYGGYGGTTPVEELIGIHWQSPSYQRVDGRAISACVFNGYAPAGLGDFLLRLNTTQYGTVSNLSVRILAR